MGRCEGRLVGQRKSAGGKDGRGGLHGEKKALGRSVEKRRVGPQNSVCEVGGHQQMSEENPEIRCRLVARDFRGFDKDREHLFAASPPWELKRLLMSHAANRFNGKARKMLLIDVKKAHLNSECTEDVFIELLEEVGAPQDKVGKLRRWLYGFRPAAAAWEAHYANKLGEVGCRRGLATPVSFYHKEKDVDLVVHGDDFTFTGDDVSLRWVEEIMSQWYEVKVRARLGPGDQDDKEATLLGRIVRWEAWGISCEANPKHRESVLEALSLMRTRKA